MWVVSTHWETLNQRIEPGCRQLCGPDFSILISLYKQNGKQPLDQRRMTPDVKSMEFHFADLKLLCNDNEQSKIDNLQTEFQKSLWKKCVLPIYIGTQTKVRKIIIFHTLYRLTVILPFYIFIKLSPTRSNYKKNIPTPLLPTSYLKNTIWHQDNTEETLKRTLTYHNKRFLSSLPFRGNGFIEERWFNRKQSNL